MFKSTDRISSVAVSVILLSASVMIFSPAAADAATDRSAAEYKALTELGRTPTSDELQAWDIDVRSDFKGLPAGQGSVDEGLDVWESKCASCHGVFGESNQIFTPLIGGTTEDDIEVGHVAALARGNSPHRTTMMRLSRISTLWDYINRAMPWNAPKSLQADEVYAVIAYMLELSGIVAPDFVLSNDNIAQIQERLPNRNGLRFYEPLWAVDGIPDVQGDNCMSDCATEIDIRSAIPDYARNAHGNLADQNRFVGATRGVDTTRKAPASLSEARAMAEQSLLNAERANDPRMTPAAGAPATDPAAQAEALARSKGCLACHGVDKALLGPAFKAVAERYKGQNDALALLTDRVIHGTQGAWGSAAMPANGTLNDAEAASLVGWVLSQ